MSTHRLSSSQGKVASKGIKKISQDLKLWPSINCPHHRLKTSFNKAIYIYIYIVFNNTIIKNIYYKIN